MRRKVPNNSSVTYQLRNLVSTRNTIVITGAAAGIGNAIARRFLQKGWRVGALDVAPMDSLRDVTGPGELWTGHLDVSDSEEWKVRLEEFCGPSGRLNALVNNAGILAAGPFAETAMERHRAVVDVNVTGTMNGCHTAHPYLDRTPGATVVNLCSASAIYGQAELSSYSASKFAVRGLTEALEIEWAHQDIRVLAIWPLFVHTDMVDGVSTGTTRSLGIRLTAEDVADTVLQAVEHRGRMPKVHYPVGVQAKVLANLSKFSPNWASRATNKLMASR